MSLTNKFFDALNAGATWSAGVAFKRSNALPLDRYSVFASVEEARTYAQTNPVAYLGQVITVVNDTKIDTDADGAKDSLLQSVVAYGIYPVYTLLTSKPADWDDNWKNYFELGSDGYVALGDTKDAAPEAWEGLYVASKDIMQLGVVLEADNYSIEEIDGVLQIKGFGAEYYAQTETGYELTEGFVAGLEPRVVADGDHFKIAWYEPSSITVEGLNSAITTINQTIAGHTETIGTMQTAIADRYTKSETDTKIAEAVENAGHIERTIVDGVDLEANTYLITDAESGEDDAFECEENVIYMVKDTNSIGADKYNDYMLIDGQLVQIGDTSVDLTDIEEGLETATSTANAAKTASETATSTANEAKTASETATSTANSASSVANEAKTASETATSTANTAKNVADEAKEESANALQKATTAESNSSAAISASSSATTVANNAKTAADNAVETANSASSKADNAVATASTASTNASAALDAANSATSTANTANTTANAAKTASETATSEVASLKATVANMYSKAETETYVSNAIGSAGHLKRSILTADELALLDANTADKDTIYMVKDTSVAGDDQYIEYMWIEGAMTVIGHTSVDLSPYTKTELLLSTLETMIATSGLKIGGVRLIYNATDDSLDIEKVTE